jgi:hypothetical protein
MKRIIVSALTLSAVAGAAGTACAPPYGPDQRDHYSGIRDGYQGDRHDSRYRRDFHGGDRLAAHREWRRGGRIDRGDWRDAHVVD